MKLGTWIYECMHVVGVDKGKNVHLILVQDVCIWKQGVLQHLIDGYPNDVIPRMLCLDVQYSMESKDSIH